MGGSISVWAEFSPKAVGFLPNVRHGVITDFIDSGIKSGKIDYLQLSNFSELSL